ncbi:MAG: hypothetical protein ACKOWF_18900 [Chloroflexota bacterium]
MTCRGQLARVSEAVASLPGDVRENLVFVGLSVETGIQPSALQDYAEENGFPFIYAVMPADYQKAIVEQFGREALVPPMMPHFTIAPDGAVSGLSTGKQDPGAIAGELEALARGGA